MGRLYNNEGFKNWINHKYQRFRQELTAELRMYIKTEQDENGLVKIDYDHDINHFHSMGLENNQPIFYGDIMKETIDDLSIDTIRDIIMQI